MQAVPAHAVPAGPLGVRWLAYELDPLQAGALGRARVELENAGAAALARASSPPTTGSTTSATRSTGTACARRSRRSPRASAADGRARRPRRRCPPGRYRLAFDLVLEHRYWLSEIGNEMLEVDVEVGRRATPPPRSRTSRPRSSPPPDWHELVRAAHEEGYAAVGGAIDAGRDRELRAYRPAAGATRRSPSRSSARRCCRRSSRTARSPGLPAWRPEGCGALDLRRADRRRLQRDG